jgi:hypothetical protein
MPSIVSASIKVGSESSDKSIFYNNYTSWTYGGTKNSYLAYFKWDPCEVTGLVSGKSRNLNKVTGPKTRTTIDKLSKYELYPLPARSELTVKAISNTNASQEIKIMDIAGKTLLQLQSFTTETKINLSTLSPGFYVLTVTSEGTVSSFKINKQ